MTNPILQILSNSSNKSKTPIWLMRQAGRYLPEYREIRKDTKHFLDLCYNSDLACEVTLQPIRRFDFDAAIIFSDILVVPDSMGIKVIFKEQQGPVLDAIQTKEEMDKAFNKKNLDKLLPIYEAIKKVKEELPKNKALIGFSGGAWTLAAYIVEGKLSRDLAIAKVTYYNNRNFFNKLIDHLVENISQHLIKQFQAGADILQIFDSWSGMLADEDYDQLIIKPTQAIIEKVRRVYPNIPIICFPRMSSIRYEKFCAEVDCQAVSVDQYMSLKWAKDHCNNKIIQGNLDPLILFSKSKDLIKQKIDEIFEQIGDSNFIFNLGHGILPKTPIENVELLVEYVRQNG